MSRVSRAVRGLIERLPHGPAILSSSLIVPTAALNHIYLSGNQAASTMEAVHLSARARPVGRAVSVRNAARRNGARCIECGTRKRGIIVRSISFRDYTHRLEFRGDACLRELTGKLPAARTPGETVRGMSPGAG